MRKIIEKGKNFYAAKKDMLKAASAIGLNNDSIVEHGCRKIIEGRHYLCKNYNPNDFCNVPHCPMFPANAKYRFALEKYEKARSEFIVSLTFWRSK